ncbi:MAG: methylcobamide--CoM methyltransferase [Gammaproteobacteria bacterium]|nr:MAG: methylcobamide--CoM methyltransferase [Gammaproteobacteria bacterium]
MFTVSNNRPLATTITGSLPRPLWFTEGLTRRPFLEAMGSDYTFREQYFDAVTAVIGDQVRAGVDIVTDGDMRFDNDIGGRSWFGYLFERMEGLGDIAMRHGGSEWASRTGSDDSVKRVDAPGDILHEVMESRLPPRILGPVRRGSLQYDAIFKAAQRLTDRPVKIGSCCGQMVHKNSVDDHYKTSIDAVMAFSDALNEEYHAVADAGAQVLQIEEPCLHFVAGSAWDISLDDYVTAFNREVTGLRDRLEVWCHTCWGNPLAQKVEANYSYEAILPYLDQLDVDVVTFETADNDGAELKAIASGIGKNKKICIGGVTHRTLQVENPNEVASLVRRALEVIDPDRLLISSDCGFGRQGMSRMHAFYKMVALVKGVNMVRAELGLDVAEAPAALGRYDFLKKF